MNAQQMTIDQVQKTSSPVVSEQPAAKSMSLNGEQDTMRLRGGDGHHPLVACCCILCICCGLEELCCLEAVDDCFGMCTC
ncbi:hypothetical protein M408DRAFT_328422, partial [Serendipita vermifera MAFF 305830]